jgi:tRNA A37 threonylcarbamoyladenosine dehydratase
MPDQFDRTRRLVGGAAPWDRLRRARVVLFGLGGVGSYAAEALARAGVGHIELVDSDTVGLTNINRQLVALLRHSDAGRRRHGRARPGYLPRHGSDRSRDVRLRGDGRAFDFSLYDCVLDAIDTVSAKLLIIDACRRAGTPVVSSMGTGNRLDPSKLAVGDIYETSGDPLASVMRHELRKLGVERLQVIYSTEEPRKPSAGTGERRPAGPCRASVSFVPPCAGMLLAGTAIRD